MGFLTYGYRCRKKPFRSYNIIVLLLILMLTYYSNIMSSQNLNDWSYIEEFPITVRNKSHFLPVICNQLLNISTYIYIYILHKSQQDLMQTFGFFCNLMDIFQKKYILYFLFCRIPFSTEKTRYIYSFSISMNNTSLL